MVRRLGRTLAASGVVPLTIQSILIDRAQADLVLKKQSLRKEPIKSIVTRIRKEYKPTLLITSIRFYEKFNFQEGIKKYNVE
jgi:hypothetical protein